MPGSKFIRSRYFAAGLLVVGALVAIGGAFASQPVRNTGLCWSNDENWNPTGGQYASHKASSGVAVLLVCEPNVDHNNPCYWCLEYQTLDFLGGGVWGVFDPGQEATVQVECGDAEREVWTTWFNNIPNGTYKTTALLYNGACDNPNRLLVEGPPYVEWKVTY